MWALLWLSPALRGRTAWAVDQMAATHCYSKLHRSCPRSHRSRRRNDCWPHTVGCSRAWNPSDSSCWLNTEGCRGVLGAVKYSLLFQLQQCRENKMSKDAFNQGRNYNRGPWGCPIFSESATALRVTCSHIYISLHKCGKQQGYYEKHSTSTNASS